ncbi:MAG: bactofilin family protein [Hyphomicrobium sp.]
MASNPNTPSSSTKFDGPDGAVFIGKGTQVVGEISDCIKAVIRGRIEGNIDTRELIVESEGSLVGNIRAHHMEVHGRIEGNANVQELANISSTGLITGDLVYGQLAVAAGGQVHGTIRQSSGPDRPADERPANGNGATLTTEPEPSTIQ